MLSVKSYHQEENRGRCNTNKHSLGTHSIAKAPLLQQGQNSIDIESRNVGGAGHRQSKAIYKLMRAQQRTTTRGFAQLPQEIVDAPGGWLWI